MNQKINQLKQNGFEVEVFHRRYTHTDWTNLKNLAQTRRREIKNIIRRPIAPDEIDLDFVARETIQEPLKNEQIIDRRDISPRGGETVVMLKKDGKAAYGVAKCSWHDNFNRRIGVSIALGNAINSFNVNQ